MGESACMHARVYACTHAYSARICLLRHCKSDQARMHVVQFCVCMPDSLRCTHMQLLRTMGRTMHSQLCTHMQLLRTMGIKEQCAAADTCGLVEPLTCTHKCSCTYACVYLWRDDVYIYIYKKACMYIYRAPAVTARHNSFPTMNEAC